ncbi:MAG TPA: ATP-binding protein [Blastocatellia bacterium]|nr:ATP-binding protein [Blastocatellia bacterium]
MVVAFYQRNLEAAVYQALTDTPIVLLIGARQAGKSWLARRIAEKISATYLTLDDMAVFTAASVDSQGFIAGLPGPVVLDEAQRVPALFLAIKSAVDRDRRPGRFLLTGSANVLLLPRIADSLAGRMEVLTLWPLSQGEIKGIREGFVDTLFSDSLPLFKEEPADRAELLTSVLRGGYPEALARQAPDRRAAWFSSYITTILQRDVRDIANIEDLTALPRLLTLLATRPAALLNFADISRSLGIPQTTLKRYMALLETTFLIQQIPAWFANLGKRLTKSPKLVISDTGLLSYLSGLSMQRLEEFPDLLGGLLENFVAMELRKQLAWSERQPQLFHFRSQTGQEVDLALEDNTGQVVGIEVKASASIHPGDLSGLKALANLLGERFRRGVVLYLGRQIVPFQENIHALPISALWMPRP